MKEHGVPPTAIDVLKFFMFLATQYGKHGNYLYLNIGIGILVMEKIDPRVYIVKTFLLPAMLDESVEWHMMILPGVSETAINFESTSNIIDIFKSNRNPISPSFMEEDLSYAFYAKLLPLIKDFL